MSGRKDFLNQPAPENYVAGLGRGATGFTTRSDLGPAREGPSEDQIKAALQKRAEQLGTAAPSAYGVPEKKAEDDEEDDRYADPENETGLFAGGDFTREDQEADEIFAAVDEKLEKRRRTRREAREAQERAEYEANNPKIQQQFSDLKRGLSAMSEEDWASLPEPGDLTRKNKRMKQDRMANNRHYAVPDSVIAGARDAMQMDTSVQEDGAVTNGGAAEAIDGTLTDFRSIGQARDKVLQLRLDQATNTENGTSTTSGTSTTVDPKGYLTSLTKSEMKAGDAGVGDINRIRILLDSVIKTNKLHAPGHIALCRLESFAGKPVAARKAIMRGAELCPTSEDIWQEAITVHQEGDNHNAKVIAARALQACPMSTQLWIRAMNLENDPNSKKRVLRKALDLIPKSVQLWKQLINLQEDTNEAKLLMAKATEECPFSIELHIGLANVEFTNGNKEAAMTVLNKARSLIPTSHEIWCAAIKLSEAIGRAPDRVAKAAVKSLAQNSAMLKREEWIAEAEKCETEDAPRSAAALIQETLAYGLDPDDEDLKKIFLDDAEASIQRGKFVTARAIFAYLLRLFPTSKSAWKKSLEFEKAHGSREEYWRLLEKSCEACPDMEEFWIMNSRAKWEAGEKTEARRVLARSFQQLSSNENVFLSAVELEVKDGQISEASQLLRTARQEAGTNRIWYISVDFARKYGVAGDGVNKNESALDLVNQGLQIYPSEPRLHLQKGQIYLALGKIPQAREAYNLGTRACKSSVPLYLLLSRLEESQKLTTKARSVLERGALATKSPLIALEAVRVERRANNIAQAKTIMARALQQFPTDGALWSENIWHLEDRTKRKPRSLEAIKKVDNDPILFVTVARVFWTERKIDKAAGWFEKAILLDPDLGDTWVWYWRFLLEYGTSEKKAEVLEKIQMQEPKHGEVWARTRKDPANVGLTMEDILIKVNGLLE